jgi:hypothetical protein
MTYKELKDIIEIGEQKIAVETDRVKKEQLKKEVSKNKLLLKNALSYSEEVKDPETAVILYTTKQMNLFLALSRGVCRRIRKGYYVTKQQYLLNDLSGSKKDREKALSILRFDCSKFKDIDWNKIKFEMIENELDLGFWSF